MTCLALIISFTAIFFTAQSVIDIQIAEILCGIVSDSSFCFLEPLLIFAAVGCFPNS
jgi:hypothetical protein